MGGKTRLIGQEDRKKMVPDRIASRPSRLVSRRPHSGEEYDSAFSTKGRPARARAGAEIQSLRNRGISRQFSAFTVISPVRCRP